MYLNLLFSPCLHVITRWIRLRSDVTCIMLTAIDFHPDHWQQTAYRIIAGNYTSGQVVAEILPPPDFLEWFLRAYDILESASLRLLNDLTEDGRICWQIVIPHAFEHIVFDNQ